MKGAHMADKKANNAVTAGLAGAAIGAATAAAIITLSDKEKRKKIGQSVNDLKTKGVEQYNALKSQAAKTQKTVEKTASDIAEDVSSNIEDMQDDSKSRARVNHKN